jgi:PrkA AAA domain
MQAGSRRSVFGESHMAKSNALLGIIDRKLDVARFREQHWEGSFWEYLDIVQENPAVARNAFQRVYDMILKYGSGSILVRIPGLYRQNDRQLLRFQTCVC